MSAGVSLHSAEFRAALRALDAGARAAVEQAAVRAADRLATELRAAYEEKRVTGTAAARVEVTSANDGEVLGRRVTAKAPHAHLIEWGSVQRFTNEHGANRGRMPAGHVFVPRAVKARAALFDDVSRGLNALRPAGTTGALDVRRTGGR